MGRIPSSSGGGGGGAIYKDGDPVSVEISAGESFTVPDGETWVATVAGHGDSSSQIHVNDWAVTGSKTNEWVDHVDIVLAPGDSVGTDSGSFAKVSGWSV